MFASKQTYYNLRSRHFPASCRAARAAYVSRSRLCSLTIPFQTLRTMTARACGFVVFRRIQGMIEYLLMQTSYGEHHWTPPKGHVDPGESDMETALRETTEEAGLVASDLKIFEDAKEELTYDVGGQPKIVIYWLAELLNQDKPIQLSAEHQAFKWLRVDEACSVAKYQEMQHTLKSFHDYIHKNIS